MLAEHYRRIEDEKSAFEIEAALSFIAAEFKQLLDVIPTLLPDSITFKYLWAILPPDCLIVGKDALNIHCMWSVRSHSVQQMQDGIFFVIDAEYLIWDGTRVGTVQASLLVPLFAGVKLISDLPYIPLKYHPEREEVMKDVRERSSRALAFWAPGFKHLEHSGTGLAEVYDKVKPYPVSR